MLIKLPNDDYFQQQKEKLIKSAPTEFTSELEKLCDLQKELTRLELQLENTEKVFQVFNIKNIQGIYAEKGNITVGGNFSMENNTIQNADTQSKIETKG